MINLSILNGNLIIHARAVVFNRVTSDNVIICINGTDGFFDIASTVRVAGHIELLYNVQAILVFAEVLRTSNIIVRMQSNRIDGISLCIQNRDYARMAGVFTIFGDEFAAIECILVDHITINGSVED